MFYLLIVKRVNFSGGYYYREISYIRVLDVGRYVLTYTIFYDYFIRHGRFEAYFCTIFHISYTTILFKPITSSNALNIGVINQLIIPLIRSIIIVIIPAVSSFRYL